MSENGGRSDRPERRVIADAVAARKRAQAVSGLRGWARPGSLPPRSGNGAATGSGATSRHANRPGGEAGAPVGAREALPPGVEACDICGIALPENHRHLLHLVERRIICSCEPCWGMRGGEGDYRPVGTRTVWLPELDLPDEVWAGFQIPIGLAFFMHSTVTACIVAMYPSPAGATESELHFDSWERVCELNPVLRELEPDVEGLIVNRLSDPPVYAIAPIDRCYGLVGAIKATWEGISGGAGVDKAVTRFFDDLRTAAVPA